MGDYNTAAWRKLRSYVIKRDNNTCQVCGYEDGNSRGSLHAHHIIPRSEGGPEHAENLVSLCNKCHRKYEGRKVNPANPNNIHFDDVVDWAVQDTVKWIVDDEISSDRSLYRSLILKNPHICSNCHEYKYSISGKDVNVETSGKRIKKVINSDYAVHSFPPIDKSPVCYSCQQLDYIWPENKTMNFDELMQHGHKIRDFLQASDVDFDIDIFYRAIKQNKRNPDMQWENRKILKYAVEYSVNY